MINQYNGDTPTLRLLCSITGGTTKAQWEDVTGSTPLTFVNDCVSFTTTVSARFWLMDCRQVNEATRFATELYNEAVNVPFMAKFVVFSKRTDPMEAQMRVFCMTDDKEDKTLEVQEHFHEVAKSRDVEVLENKSAYLEFAGNLVPITKSGEQLSLTFQAFRENRIPFNMRIKDVQEPPLGRIIFMKESRNARSDAPQAPICNLNIELPEIMSPSANVATLTWTQRDGFGEETGLFAPDAILKAQIRLNDLCRDLGSDWVQLAKHLDIPQADIENIQRDNPDNEQKQAVAMLRLWIQRNPNVNGNMLERALRKIHRDTLIARHMHNIAPVTDELERAVAKTAIDQPGFDLLQDELGSSRSLKRETSLDVSYDERDMTKEAESAEDTSSEAGSMRNKHKATPKVPSRSTPAPIEIPEIEPFHLIQEKEVIVVVDKPVEEDKISNIDPSMEHQIVTKPSAPSISRTEEEDDRHHRRVTDIIDDADPHNIQHVHYEENLYTDDAGNTTVRKTVTRRQIITSSDFVSIPQEESSGPIITEVTDDENIRIPKDEPIAGPVATPLPPRPRAPGEAKPNWIDNPEDPRHKKVMFESDWAEAPEFTTESTIDIKPKKDKKNGKPVSDSVENITAEDLDALMSKPARQVDEFEITPDIMPHSEAEAAVIPEYREPLINDEEKSEDLFVQRSNEHLMGQRVEVESIGEEPVILAQTQALETGAKSSKPVVDSSKNLKGQKKADPSSKSGKGKDDGKKDKSSVSKPQISEQFSADLLDQMFTDDPNKRKRRPSTGDPVADAALGLAGRSGVVDQALLDELCPPEKTPAYPPQDMVPEHVVIPEYRHGTKSTKTVTVTETHSSSESGEPETTSKTIRTVIETTGTGEPVVREAIMERLGRALSEEVLDDSDLPAKLPPATDLDDQPGVEESSFEKVMLPVKREIEEGHTATPPASPNEAIEEVHRTVQVRTEHPAEGEVIQRTDVEETTADGSMKRTVTTVTKTTIVQDTEDMGGMPVMPQQQQQVLSATKPLESETWGDIDTSQVSVSSLPEDERTDEATATLSSTTATGGEPETHVEEWTEHDPDSGGIRHVVQKVTTLTSTSKDGEMGEMKDEAADSLSFIEKRQYFEKLATDDTQPPRPPLGSSSSLDSAAVRMRPPVVAPRGSRPYSESFASQKADIVEEMLPFSDRLKLFQSGGSLPEGSADDQPDLQIREAATARDVSLTEETWRGIEKDVIDAQLTAEMAAEEAFQPQVREGPAEEIKRLQVRTSTEFSGVEPTSETSVEFSRLIVRTSVEEITTEESSTTDDISGKGSVVNTKQHDSISSANQVTNDSSESPDHVDVGASVSFASHIVSTHDFVSDNGDETQKFKDDPDISFQPKAPDHDDDDDDNDDKPFHDQQGVCMAATCAAQSSYDPAVAVLVTADTPTPDVQQLKGPPEQSLSLQAVEIPSASSHFDRKTLMESSCEDLEQKLTSVLGEKLQYETDDLIPAEHFSSECSEGKDVVSVQDTPLKSSSSLMDQSIKADDTIQLSDSSHALRESGKGVTRSSTLETDSGQVSPEKEFPMDPRPPQEEKYTPDTEEKELVKTFQMKGTSVAQYALLGEKMTPDESGYDSVPVGSSPLKLADQEKANRAACEKFEEREEDMVAEISENGNVTMRSVDQTEENQVSNVTISEDLSFLNDMDIAASSSFSTHCVPLSATYSAEGHSSNVDTETSNEDQIELNQSTVRDEFDILTSTTLQTHLFRSTHNLLNEEATSSHTLDDETLSKRYAEDDSKTKNKTLSESEQKSSLEVIDSYLEDNTSLSSFATHTVYSSSVDQSIQDNNGVLSLPHEALQDVLLRETSQHTIKEKSLVLTLNDLSSSLDDETASSSSSDQATSKFDKDALRENVSIDLAKTSDEGFNNQLESFMHDDKDDETISSDHDSKEVQLSESDNETSPMPQSILARRPSSGKMVQFSETSEVIPEAECVSEDSASDRTFDVVKDDSSASDRTFDIIKGDDLLKDRPFSVVREEDEEDDGDDGSTSSLCIHEEVADDDVSHQLAEAVALSESKQLSSETERDFDGEQLAFHESFDDKCSKPSQLSVRSEEDLEDDDIPMSPSVLTQVASSGARCDGGDPSTPQPNGTNNNSSMDVEIGSRTSIPSQLSELDCEEVSSPTRKMTAHGEVTYMTQSLAEVSVTLQSREDSAGTELPYSEHAVDDTRTSSVPTNTASTEISNDQSRSSPPHIDSKASEGPTPVVTTLDTAQTANDSAVEESGVFVEGAYSSEMRSSTFKERTVKSESAADEIRIEESLAFENVAFAGEEVIDGAIEEQLSSGSRSPYEVIRSEDVAALAREAGQKLEETFASELHKIEKPLDLDHPPKTPPASPQAVRSAVEMEVQVTWEAPLEETAAIATETVQDIPPHKQVLIEHEEEDSLTDESKSFTSKPPLKHIPSEISDEDLVEREDITPPKDSVRLTSDSESEKDSPDSKINLKNISHSASAVDERDHTTRLSATPEVTLRQKSSLSSQEQASRDAASSSETDQYHSFDSPAKTPGTSRPQSSEFDINISSHPSSEYETCTTSQDGSFVTAATSKGSSSYVTAKTSSGSRPLSGESETSGHLASFEGSSEASELTLRESPNEPDAVSRSIFVHQTTSATGTCETTQTPCDARVTALKQETVGLDDVSLSESSVTHSDQTIVEANVAASGSISQQHIKTSEQISSSIVQGEITYSETFQSMRSPEEVEGAAIREDTECGFEIIEAEKLIDDKKSHDEFEFLSHQDIPATESTQDTPTDGLTPSDENRSILSQETSYTSKCEEYISHLQQGKEHTLSDDVMDVQNAKLMEQKSPLEEIPEDFPYDTNVCDDYPRMYTGHHSEELVDIRRPRRRRLSPIPDDRCSSGTPETDTQSLKRSGRNSERDDASNSSLQEFERLEAEMLASGARSSLGSSADSHSSKHINNKADSDDISAHSINDLEKLEKEIVDVESSVDITDQDDTVVRLQEIEEGRESQASEHCISTEASFSSTIPDMEPLQHAEIKVEPDSLQTSTASLHDSLQEASDSLQQEARSIDTDSLTGDKLAQAALQDSLYEAKDIEKDALSKSKEAHQFEPDSLTGSIEGKLPSEENMEAMKREIIQSLEGDMMATSTDSLEPSVSVLPPIGQSGQYETDSAMSWSFYSGKTSTGGESTMISSTDSLEPARGVEGDYDVDLDSLQLTNLMGRCATSESLQQSERPDVCRTTVVREYEGIDDEGNVVKVTEHHQTSQLQSEKTDLAELTLAEFENLGDDSLSTARVMTTRTVTTVGPDGEQTTTTTTSSNEGGDTLRRSMEDMLDSFMQDDKH